MVLAKMLQLISIKQDEYWLQTYRLLVMNACEQLMDQKWDVLWLQKSLLRQLDLKHWQPNHKPFRLEWRLIRLFRENPFLFVCLFLFLPRGKYKRLL